MIHMSMKNRVVAVSEKNMDGLVSLYIKCSRDEMERIVNNIIDNAVAEIREDEGRLHMNQQEKKVPECNGCRFARMYDYGKKIYYCDNEDRTDDMGKLGMDDPSEISPVWCPMRGK